MEGKEMEGKEDQDQVRNRTIQMSDSLWNEAKAKAGDVSLAAIIRILLQMWVKGEVEITL